MKRPGDQAKLLFLYLLRSSASALQNASEGHVCLRLATRSDIPSIQRCNLATLPENYNANFYVEHLRNFPDLAIIAEHVHPNSRSRNPASFPGLNAPEPNIVGYVLGKIQDRYIPTFDQAPDGTDRFTDMAGQAHRLESIGHVTSLAVRQEWRRKGLAGAMMKQLHFHLDQVHDVDSVGLHVRQSNKAARGLYERQGYYVDQVIDRYYADGESAYLMCKPLEASAGVKHIPHSVPPQQQGLWRMTQPQQVKPWQQTGPLQLPRVIWDSHEQKESAIQQEQIAQVMTGI